MMTPDWTHERPSEPGEYWVSIEPSKRQETQKFLLLAKMRPVERVTLLVAVGCGKELDGELLVNFRSDDTTFPMFLKCFDGAKWSRRETPADPFIAQTTPTGKKYVILDSRQIVGNCALFWRPDGAGYTCDLNDAGLYDKTRSRRDTDIYVPIEVARSMAVTHVRVEPLKRAGYWPKPPVIKRQPQRCEGCPRFVKRGGWLCPKCHEKETRKPS